MYGALRTLLKVAGRADLPCLARFTNFIERCVRPTSLIKGDHRVAMAGCGQFAFATLGFFLSQTRVRFSSCYDVNPNRAKRFARVYGASVALEEHDLYSNTDILFVASDHRSHPAYAVNALTHGIHVHIEKPLAVEWDHLKDLHIAVRANPEARVASGYNRPFAPAIRRLRRYVSRFRSTPILSNMAVQGHHLAPEHWYLNPEQGTRIAGNLGHWIDLTLHLWLSRGLAPRNVECHIVSCDMQARDDNAVFTLRSDTGDVSVISLFSRVEPFEGINEQIVIQGGQRIFQIDDFRSMTIQSQDRFERVRYRKKDVGHGAAAIEVLKDRTSRDWNEIMLSSLLVLSIRDMALGSTSRSVFDLPALWETTLSESFPFNLSESEIGH